MSTVIARRVASSPARTAGETWRKIVEMLGADDTAQQELAFAAGVACSAIASDATKDDAIVIWGGGSRVRVYTLFGDDAITGDGVNEDALVTSPCKGDWQMSIPCPAEDLAWSKAKLSTSKRIRVRAQGADVDDDSKEATQKVAPLAINLEEFLKA